MKRVLVLTVSAAGKTYLTQIRPDECVDVHDRSKNNPLLSLKIMQAKEERNAVCAIDNIIAVPYPYKYIFDNANIVLLYNSYHLQLLHQAGFDLLFVLPDKRYKQIVDERLRERNLKYYVNGWKNIRPRNIKNVF